LRNFPPSCIEEQRSAQVVEKETPFSISKAPAR